MAKSIQTLKSYFLDGKKPTENEFADLIEAFVHRNDDLKTILGNIAELAEAQAGVVNDKYMTPFLTKAAIVALTRLANIPALKTELEGLFLGKTAKAADSDKLDGKHAADFLLKTSVSDLPSDSRAGKVASSKALKNVSDRLPSWTSSSNKEGFLEVICAGRIDKTGARRDWWGKDRVGGFPYSVQKLAGTGEYKITHNYGNSVYGLVGNGTIGNDSTNDRGYNMFVSIKHRNANDCTVIVGNDSAADDAAFSFILRGFK